MPIYKMPIVKNKELGSKIERFYKNNNMFEKPITNIIEKYVKTLYL